MSAFDPIVRAGAALVLVAFMVCGPATATALRGPKTAPASPAAGRSFAQASPRLDRAPSIFQGMMIPGMQRERDCSSSQEIHNRLKLQGWWDFDDLERDGERFTVQARRPNGAAYQLTIDGCSGRVLGAMRLDGVERGYRLWPR